MIDTSKLSDAELLAYYRKLRETADKFKEMYPTAGFVPNGPQERFIKLYAEGRDSDGKSFYDYVACWGNGVGKSTLMVNLIYNICAGPQSEWWDYELFKKWPYPKHLMLMCNGEQVKPMKGALWHLINQWWPKSEYKAHKLGFDYDSLYEFPKTGFTLDVMTFGQPVQSFESKTIGAVFSDEEPPRHLYLPSSARMRYGGKRSIFATLVFDSAWIYEDLLEKPTTGFFYADIEECCIEHGVRGHLKHENIQTMFAGLPDEEREARRTGKPMHLRGRVFDFNPEVHVCDDLPETGRTVLALDPHQRRPWVIVVGRQGYDGTWTIIDEWPGEAYHKLNNDFRSIGQYAEIIRGLQKKHAIQQMVIDNKFASQQIREDYDVTTLREKLERGFGLRFDAGNVRVVGDGGGVAVLKDLLRVRDGGRTGLRVHRGCTNTIHQLRNITWKEHADPNEFGTREQLDDKFLDFPRCCMYLTMREAEGVPLAGDPQKEREIKFLRKVAERRNDQDLLQATYEIEAASLYRDEDVVSV